MTLVTNVLFEYLLLVFVYNIVIALLQVRTNLQLIVFLSFRSFLFSSSLFLHILFLERLVNRFGCPNIYFMIESDRFSHLLINVIVN